MPVKLMIAVALAFLVAVGCGGEEADSGGGGTGGAAGSSGGAGTGGSAGAGGDAGSGGTAGAGGTAGTGGDGGTGGTGGAGGTGGGVEPSIECDTFQTLDDFDMVGGAAQFPTLARSGNHAAAIWAERTSSYTGVVVARYDFVTEAWSGPFDVFSQASSASPTYDVAVDADGDVAALWREVNGGNYELWVRIYDASMDVWGDPEEATLDNYSQIHAHQIEYDRASGKPMVAFITPKDGRNNAYFTRREAGGWSAAALLENHDADHLSTHMDFVANDAGQALFTYFIEVGGTTPTYYALPYASGDFRRDGSDVLDPLTFTADSGFFGGYPQTDLSNSGDGIIFVDDSLGTDRENLGVMVDIDPASLTAPAVIHEGESPTSFWLGDTAMSESGRAVAVWGQSERIGGDQHPWVSVRDGTWSTPQEVGTFRIGTAGAKTDIDDDGTITVVWSSGGDGIIATRNTAAAGAFLPQQELTGRVTGSGQVEVVAHESGDFLTVWQENVDIRAVRCR